MPLPAKPGAPGAPAAPAAPAAQQPGAAAAAPTAQIRRLKKGEVLFNEGDNSRAMYFVRTGMIRLYKKKGDSNIELDTVRAGQVLGELAFLDGNPRSASAEALTECEMMEISGPAFQQVLTKAPDWLKMLLKTVVGRLRTASTRIRQLEQASTAFDYSDKDGKRSAHYVYLSPTDVLKILSSILLVASRNGKSAGGGLEVRVGLLQRYANQIMGVPVAKITTMLDVLAECEVMSTLDDADGRTILRDADFLESLIAYMNEENLLEPSKRHDMTARGLLIMGLIVKHLPKYKVDPSTGLTLVNLAEIKNIETNIGGKEPFRVEEFQQLVKLNYATNLNIKSNTDVYTCVDPEPFKKNYSLQRVVIAVATVNEQKRSSGGKESS